MNRIAAAPNETAAISQRYKAAFVDGGVLVVTFLTSIPLVHQLLDQLDAAELTVLWMLFHVAGYEIIPVSLWGRTLGHWIFGLKVVDQTGEKPTFLQIVIRWFLKTAFGHRSFRRSPEGSGTLVIHDDATRTTVVYAR